MSRFGDDSGHIRADIISLRQEGCWFQLTSSRFGVFTLDKKRKRFYNRTFRFNIGGQSVTQRSMGPGSPRYPPGYPGHKLVKIPWQ